MPMAVTGGYASVILPNRQREYIRLDESFQVERSNYWESPITGYKFPMTYRFALPSVDLDLEINALFPEQDMGYWEGFSNVNATYKGKPMKGFSGTELNYGVN